MPKTIRRTISQRSELIYDAQEYGINVDTRELFVHGYAGDVDEEPGVDYRMAVKFVKNLNILNHFGDKPILVHMHTFGGIWPDGMAMYDAIKASKSPVTVLSYAHARSMSSIIPQAAEYRVLMPNCDFMFHPGSAGGGGCNLLSYWSDAKDNMRLYEIMINIYVGKAKHGNHFVDWTEEEIKEHFKREMEKRQEVYLTARQAVDWGLADAVLGDPNYETIEALRE